jgi:hypothetical protein
MTTREISDLYKKLIVDRADKVDPDSERRWEDIWVGFVIALERPDLANYNGYMDWGFPRETE